MGFRPEWRRFEELVAQIERVLVPDGAVVRSPDRIPDKDTGNLREVDATVRYTVGSVPILISIECRDRIGVEDVTWIEQLAAKRQSIQASVTIAVSSSGFSGPAVRKAKENGIELRQLSPVSDTDVASWIKDSKVGLEVLSWQFTQLKYWYQGNEPGLDLDPSVGESVKRDNYEAKIAIDPNSNDTLTLSQLGASFLKNGQFPVLAGIEAFGKVHLADKNFHILTTLGPRKLLSVDVTVRIHSVVNPVPIREVLEYAKLESGAIVEFAEWRATYQGQTFGLRVMKRL